MNIRNTIDVAGLELWTEFDLAVLFLAVVAVDEDEMCVMRVEKPCV